MHATDLLPVVVVCTILSFSYTRATKRLEYVPGVLAAFTLVALLSKLAFNLSWRVAASSVAASFIGVAIGALSGIVVVTLFRRLPSAISSSIDLAESLITSETKTVANRNSVAREPDMPNLEKLGMAANAITIAVAYTRAAPTVEAYFAWQKIQAVHSTFQVIVGQYVERATHNVATGESDRFRQFWAAELDFIRQVSGVVNDSVAALSMQMGQQQSTWSLMVATIAMLAAATGVLIQVLQSNPGQQ